MALPPGDTTWVRVEDATGVDGRVAALAEVDLPGLEVRRRLVLPTLPRAWGDPDRVVLRRDVDARRGCVEVGTPTGTDVRCVPGRDRDDEEATALRRAFTLAGPRTYETDVRFVPRAGRDLDRLLLDDQPVDVSASSVGVPDPRASPLAAIDGDPGTTWLAEPEDEEPELDLSWIGARLIRSVEVDVDPDTSARAPTRVEITTPTATRRVGLVDGVATFRPVRTDRMTVRVLDDDGATSLGFDSQSIPVPVGVSELRVGGVEYLPLGLSADERTYPCGTGPSVTVDNILYETRLRASPAAIARGASVEGRLCRSTGLDLDAGRHLVDVPTTSTFGLDALVLGRGAPLGGSVSPAPLEAGVTTRTVPVTSEAPVDLGPDGDLVVLRQNTNPGWDAAQDGDSLTPVVVDGWQQGWVLSDGAAAKAPVHAQFTPDGPYRVGLLVGLVLWVAFLLGLALVCVRGRRHPVEGPPVTGDLLMMRTGPGQLHLGIWTGAGLVHADAGLRRVVERPGAPPWPVLGCWRR